MEIVAHVIKEVRLLRYVIAGGLHWFILFVGHHVLKVEDGRLAFIFVKDDIVLLKQRVHEVTAVGEPWVGPGVLHLATAQIEVSLDHVVVIE